MIQSFCHKLNPSYPSYFDGVHQNMQQYNAFCHNLHPSYACYLEDVGRRAGDPWEEESTFSTEDGRRRLVGPRWTCLARWPKPRHCSDSVM
jgi:hypothetical protein